MSGPTCTFIHAADLHLDTPFVGIGETDPALARRLRDASLVAFDALVAAAIDHRVDFVILAGDIHDGAVRGVRAQMRLLAGLRKLDAAGIHTFIVHGNHDPVDEGWSGIEQWPERVHVFPADAVASIPLELPGGCVTVHGVSYRRREQVESLVPRFPRPTGPGLHVAVLHANVGGDAAHAAYSPCSVADLVATGHDYWALGHIHRAALLRAEAPRIAYPGNLQGRSFKPSERGPKGALLVTHRDGMWRDRALVLGPCRFEEVQVALEAVDDLPRLVDVLAREGETVGGAVVGETCILRAVLTGRGALGPRLRDVSMMAGLLAALRDGAPPGIHWAAVVNETRTPIDIEQLRGRDDLGGTVVAAADRLGSEPDRLRALLGTNTPGAQAARSLGDNDLKTLLDKALDRALDLLGQGETA